MLNDPTDNWTLLDDEDDDLVEDEETPRVPRDGLCGDVDREHVAHLLVEEEEVEELTGYLTW
tara:strand:+ start:151 stop:336 length:186 start_codon:yes stop_codon:yes gene_type:complete